MANPQNNLLGYNDFILKLNKLKNLVEKMESFFLHVHSYTYQMNVFNKNNFNVCNYF